MGAYCVGRVHTFYLVSIKIMGAYCAAKVQTFYHGNIKITGPYCILGNSGVKYRNMMNLYESRTTWRFKNA